MNVNITLKSFHGVLPLDRTLLLSMSLEVVLMNIFVILDPLIKRLYMSYMNLDKFLQISATSLPES